VAYKLWTKLSGVQTVDYWTATYCGLLDNWLYLFGLFNHHYNSSKFSKYNNWLYLHYCSSQIDEQHPEKSLLDEKIFEEIEDKLFSLNSQRANSEFFIQKIQPWLLVAHKKSQPSRRWRSNLKYLFLIALFRKIEDRQLSTTSLKGKLVQLASKNPLYFVDYATISIRRKDLQHLNRFNVKHCNLKSWRWKQVLLFLCFAICSIDSRLGFYNKKNRGNFTPSKIAQKIFSVLNSKSNPIKL